jgi:uncharacterized repeat protein (TIGR03803 family)
MIAKRPISLALSAAVGLAVSAASAGAASETVLYSFAGGGDGGSPEAALVFDPAGNLYGTTAGSYDQNGALTAKPTVFELSPPGNGGPWTETVLNAFKGSASPRAGLSLDPKGHLFGTTTTGGASGGGTVFKLKPATDPGKGWVKTVLFSFGGDALPMTGVILDSGGHLYGTTFLGGAGQGTVFKLRAPPDGSVPWTKTVLFKFGALSGGEPDGLLYRDPATAILYGTTYGGGEGGNGTVYELMPPSSGSSQWVAEPIWVFKTGANASVDGIKPRAGLIPDAAGNFYGTTSLGGTLGNGIVFELSPPTGASDGAWIETILHDFGSVADDGIIPLGGLAMDGSGNLYGTTERGGPGGAGAVFELSPPSGGAGPWSYSVLYGFTGGADGGQPYAGVVLDDSGNLYGTTLVGGAAGFGAVFEIIPTPAAPD